MEDEGGGPTMAPGWWRRALDDLRAARILLEDGAAAPWVVAYHAQQSVEKGIKAYLVAHGVSAADRSFRVHEIDDLRTLVSEHDRSLAESLSDADPLGDFAVEARYPPVAPGVEDVGREEARKALETAGQAMDVLHEHLSRTLPELQAPSSTPTGGDGRSRS